MVAPVDHPLTVLQASSHAPSLDPQTIRFALSAEIGAHIVNWSEAWRRRDFLLDRDSWRTTMPDPADDDDRDDRRGKYDAPVMVRRRFPMVDEWSRLMCHRSEPIKIAPPRWANGQAIVTPLGVVEDIAFHPHAAVRGLPLDLDRVQEYARGMRRLERRVERALDDNRLVIVSGDLNYPDIDGPPFSPARTFARLGLKTWTVGIDWFAWSPPLVIVDRKVYGHERTRQDHPWLRAKFSGFIR